MSDIDIALRLSSLDPDDGLSVIRLRFERARIGLCPDHGEKMGKTGKCKVCRAIRKEEIILARKIKRCVIEVYEPRRDRITHPTGYFDKAGRYYPDDVEDYGITDSIRSPSRAYPYSYLTACRAKKHCALLVRAFLDGLPVPYDVSNVCSRLLNPKP